MMDIILGLAISVFLLLATVFLSLKLPHLTWARTTWLLIAIAFALIAFRQLIKAIRFISGDLSPLADSSDELLTVAVSVIIVVGISSIAPAFLAMKNSEEEEAEPDTMADPGVCSEAQMEKSFPIVGTGASAGGSGICPFFLRHAN